MGAVTRPRRGPLQAVLGLFTPSTLDRGAAVLAPERLAATQVAMASLEHLVNAPERRPGGVNDWEVLREGMRFRSRGVRAACEVLARPTATNAAHTARLIASCVLTTPWGSPKVRGLLGLGDC